MIEKQADKSIDGTLFIGSGVVLRGEVDVPGGASIDGKFEGTLKAKNLVVGPSGHVSGEISVETAEIRGRVKDNLLVRNKLTLRSSGQLTGAVSYSRIMVEEGGSISGTVEVLEQNKTVNSPLPDADRNILRLHQVSE